MQTTRGKPFPQKWENFHQAALAYITNEENKLVDKMLRNTKKGRNCLENIGKYHFLLGNWIASWFLGGFKLMEINGNLGLFLVIVHEFYHGKSPSLTTIWENMFWFNFSHPHLKQDTWTPKQPVLNGCLGGWGEI